MKECAGVLLPLGVGRGARATSVNSLSHNVTPMFTLRQSWCGTMIIKARHKCYYSGSEN